jgi:predicted NACHT family NTPase
MEHADGQRTAGTVIIRDTLLRICQEHVSRLLSVNASHGALAMVNDLRERNGVLCFIGDRAYAFAHRSFLEYFCARAIS